MISKKKKKRLKFATGITKMKVVHSNRKIQKVAHQKYHLTLLDFQLGL
jgi:hypothetical protein